MKFSIIVPVLNEAERIEGLIDSLQKLDGDKEIIISDGGSTDGTLEKLSVFDSLTVINAHSGRAVQMNEGAAVSVGSILWFLHADSLILPSSLHDIEAAVNEGALGGFVRLYFYDADDGFMNFIARTSHTRARKFCLIFGDQGLFLKRETFFELGGFADVALMEDWEISRRLKGFHNRGLILALDTSIGTSARRYMKNGRLKTWLKMNLIKALYILGMKTEFLRFIYDGRKCERSDNIFEASHRQRDKDSFIAAPE